ncbi:MAG: type IV pilus assembly protein PilM [Candidatus Andersenbacteria bacterium]|nr:type IV pilus assembly protein PilM [bacterium]MDZ4225465.1 type IV pilus assembly protein PilM [Candidatus Andersenbacteria bacterium]
MVGIDVSERSIKIVELAGGMAPKLRTVCWSSLAPNLMRRGVIQDAVVMGETIEAALIKCTPMPVSSRTAVVSIPETQSFVRVLELPKMSIREMDEAVQWAIRHHIPFDLDRVYLDWQPLINTSGNANRQQVLVGAAQRDVIDPLLGALDMIGLRVVALELEAQAIVRSLLPLDAADVSGVLLVDLGATATDIIFFDRGAMRFTGSIQRGGDDLTQNLAQELKIQPAIAAEKKASVGLRATEKDPQVAATLRKATLELVEQVHKVAQELIAQLNLPDGIKTVLLSGGAANLPGLVDVFSEIFPSVPVQLGNSLINLVVGRESKAATISPADAMHFTTAIGLALRQEEVH